MRKRDTYIRYPADLRWDKKKATELWKWADVVHLNNGIENYKRFGGGKPVVIHHQGTRLRTDPEKVSGEAKSIGATEVVSTLDLIDCAPGSSWLPSAFDIAEITAYRRENKTTTIRIAHAPTARSVKGTQYVIDAVEMLKEFYDIKFDLIEGLQWKACLSRKGMADIFIDQLVLGYGNNAIEAWAMGIPVVCGVTTARGRMLETFGELPFYEATPETLVERLADLIESKELREEYGERGLKHVQTWHDEKVVAEILRNIYEVTV